MTPTTVKYGANSHIVGKTDPQKLSHATAFRPTEGTLRDLADHIGKGHPWMPALLDKRSRRWQQNANYAEILAADIDDHMTIEEALQHAFIATHCGLAIKSSSSSPKHHKFRLTFRLPEPLTDWQTIRICNRYLIHLLEVADSSCKDASRFFFGALGRSPFLLNEAATLPANFVEEAIAWHTEQDRIIEEAYQAATSRRQQYQSTTNDLEDRVREALSFIPPRSPGSGNYDEVIRVAMALTHEFGEAMAIAILEWWSPSIPNTSWNIPRKVASFRRGCSRPVTIATVFKLAMRHGYRPPKREPDPFGWLRRITHPKRPKAVKVPPQAKSETSNSQIQEYAQGERLQQHQQAIAQGYRHILDRSVPGAGKSFDSGNIDLQAFKVQQGIYLSSQHRNPTVETLSAENGWVDLEARHAGLTREDTPGGSTRLRRSKRNEAPHVPANCDRTNIVSTLRAKNVQGADSASVVCGTCPMKEACGHAEGSGYGFLNQRRSALSSPKLRAHPASLPNPAEYDFDGTLLPWDEAGENFTTKRDIHITRRDLEQTIAALLNTPSFERVQALLTTLLPYFDGSTKTPKYGLSHFEVVKLMPDVSAIDVDLVEQQLQPDLSFLDTTAEYGVELADLPPSIRKQFAKRDQDGAALAEERVAKQWVASLLRILQGDLGAIHLNRQTLTISLPDNRHRTIASAARANIFLDATLSHKDLALKLGCSPDEIFVCAQQMPETKNLTITQIMDLGRLGMQRGANQQKRAEAIENHFRQQDPASTKTIDFKKFEDDTKAIWWRDSRGINDFETTRTLILVGTPCRNLSDQRAEFAILTGRCDFDEAEFQAWVDRQIRADVLQAIGRLRAHRRFNEQLQVVWLSNFELGIPTQQVLACEITLEAASKRELFNIAAKQAIAQLQATGEKVTQSAVAALAGYSQQYVSRCWKLLQTLLGATDSKSGKDAPEDLVAIAEEAFSKCETQAQAIACTDNIFFDWLKSHQHHYLWQKLDAATQISILEALILTLPEHQIKALGLEI